MNPTEATESAIARVIEDFRGSPGRYFTEEDVRWRLMKEIEASLAALGASEVTLKDGTKSGAVHGEYPTPFRCSMAQNSFEVLAPTETRGHRGHFDIVVLNASAVANCSFEVVRSQYFKLFLGRLPTLPLPFLDTVIEVKLYRDIAHQNRTDSVGEQAGQALLAVRKAAAALAAQGEYYAEPFAQRGTVLLFDNSHLVCGANADVEASRNLFGQTLDRFDWRSIPGTLTCKWITPDGIRVYEGRGLVNSLEPTTAPS